LCQTAGEFRCCHDASIEFGDLCLQHPQLRTQSGNAVACGFRHAIEQLLDAIAPNWCHDAKLGQTSADRIDDRILLAREEVRVRWSIRQLCSDVLASTNRIFGRTTASQIASASAASFFCRFILAPPNRGHLNSNRIRHARAGK
jgi:hypothetical protein